MRRVGLVGFGAIGIAITRAWRMIDASHQLVAVLVRETAADAARAQLPGQVAVMTDIDDFLAQDLDVCVEAAGQGFVKTHGDRVAGRCRAFSILSAGALVDDVFRAELLATAARRGGRLQIPCGALGGFDSLLAMRASGLREVRYTSTKPVEAWRGTFADADGRLDGLSRPYVLFEGSARDAAARYPKNANLAAAVAFAGLGLGATQVKLVADPEATVNTGRVEARSEAGRLDLTIESAGDPANPKTSTVTALSVLSSLINQEAVLQFV